MALGGGAWPDFTLELWDPIAQETVASLPSPRGILDIAFSPQGSILAASESDGSVTLWDIVAHTPVATLGGGPVDLGLVEFSPDNRLIAAAGPAVYLWDVSSHTIPPYLTGDHHSLVDHIESAVVYAAHGTEWLEDREHYTWQLSTWGTGGWGPHTDGWFEASRQEGSFWANAVASGGETRSGIVAHPRYTHSWATVGEYHVAQPLGVTGAYGLVDGRTTSLASVRFVIQVVDGDVHTTVLDQTVSNEAGWNAFSLDLRAWSDRTVTFRLITDANGTSAEDWAFWADVDIVTDLAGGIVEPVGPSEITLRNHWLYDPSPGGNADGVADAGERLHPRIRLRNDSVLDVQNARVRLTTDDADVTVVDGNVQHGIWPAGEARNNNGFVLDIAPGATAHDVNLVVDVTADNGGPWQFTVTFPVVAGAPTFVRRNAWIYEPKTSTRNGHADAGERVYPRVRLINEGPEDAENVTVTLSTDDPEVTVVNGTVTHAAWQAGVARNNDGFVLDISPDATSHDVSMTVDVTADNGGPWQFTFTFPVVAPALTFSKRNAWIYEPTVPTRNGHADAGERVQPRVRLMNEGPEDAENVTVTLSTDDPDVTVVTAAVTHATWPAGLARNNNGLVLDIAPDATSHEVSMTVDVTADNGGPWQFTFTFPVVAPALTFAKRNAWIYEPKAATRNGYADAGERVQPRVRLTNKGPEDAENVTVTLSTDNSDVTVVTASVSHATWPAGVARNNNGLVLDIAPDATSHEVSMTVDVTADNGGPWQFTFTFPVVAPTLTFTKRNAWIYDPTPRADKDGVAEPEERVRPRIRLRNDGPGDALNVRATLSVDDPDVTVVRAEETHATWPVGAARKIVGFVLDISANATAHDVTAVVDVTADNAGPWQFTFTFPIVPGPPEFTLRNAWVYDPAPGGNKNGVADAGESVLPRVRLLNEGQTEAENVVVSLGADHANITVTGATVTHATWPARAARNNNGLAVDIGVEASGTVTFTVEVTADNAGPWQFTFDVVVTPSAAPTAVTAFRPAVTALLPNYPNPFNPETWIPFQLSEDAEVTVTVYDALGQVVRRLDLGQQPPGVYRTTSRAAYWDGRNDRGEEAASGVYFVELTAGDTRQTRRIVLLK